jgi:hypothetical protein
LFRIRAYQDINETSLLHEQIIHQRIGFHNLPAQNLACREPKISFLVNFLVPFFMVPHGDPSVCPPSRGQRRCLHTRDNATRWRLAPL